MAVTTNQLEAVCSSTPFLQRVEYAITLTAENIATESAGTARHAARAALATQVLNSPGQYAASMAPGIVAQMTLASTNMVTVGGVANADVDTTDAALATIVSSIWNDYLGP